MNRRRILWTALLCVLSLWLTVILAAGMAAAVVFTNLPPLEPTAPIFEGLAQPYQARLIAGVATEGAFRIADVAQLICFPLAMVLFLLLEGKAVFRKVRPIERQLRGCLLIAGLLLVLIRWQWVGFQMQEHLAVERHAAQTGLFDKAIEAQNLFLELHPIAAHLWEASALVIGLAFVLHVWAAVHSR
jgi:hypothetical protein